MDAKQLADILTELSSASKAITNPSELQSLMGKYDMIFAGKSYNCINTIELRHTLEKTFHLNISLEELNSLVPPTCSKLGMRIVPFINAANPEETIPYCYQIFL